MEIPSVQTLISTYGLLRIRYPGPQFCGPNVHVLLSEQKHQTSCFASDRKRQLKLFYCSDRNSKEHGFTCVNKTLCPTNTFYYTWHLKTDSDLSFALLCRLPFTQKRSHRIPVYSIRTSEIQPV